MTKTKLAILGLAVITAAAGGGYYLAQTGTTTTFTDHSKIDQAVEEAVNETARRYETQLQEREGDIKEIVLQLQHEVISKLQRDESGGEDSGGDVFYTNDPRSALRGECGRVGGLRNIECDSWGVMQFKIPTVIYYYQILYGEELNQKQALQLALDDDRARALATDIIFKVEGGVWNWSAANNDASYYSYQIPFIRSLMEKIE